MLHELSRRALQIGAKSFPKGLYGKPELGFMIPQYLESTVKYRFEVHFPHDAIGGKMPKEIDFPLEAHATYSAHIRWEFDKFSPTPPRDTYQFYAEYDGNSPNLFKSAPCWTGKINSKEVQLLVQ